MEIITYGLRKSKCDSDQYYLDIKILADETQQKFQAKAGQIITDFQLHLHKPHMQSNQFDLESVLDLLTLGILWRCYVKETDLFGFKKLLLWLTTVEDLYYEEIRLQACSAFFLSQPIEKTKAELGVIHELAAWFEQRCAEALGDYTINVENFRRDICVRDPQREDFFLRNRKPIEYHLNMVGAELMNRALRKAFMASDRKIVLAPACMCIQKNCQATAVGAGFYCSGCTADCRVNQITQLGQKHNFLVFIIPHNSSLLRLTQTEDLMSAGIVGIACVLNLLQGGWMLQSMGIPAQCVLLDYCGCQTHWHKTAIPTDINLNQLQKILTAN